MPHPRPSPEFRDLWRRYTAPSDNRTSTVLRTLSDSELSQAVDDLVALWLGVVVAEAQTSGEVRFATLADLT